MTSLRVALFAALHGIFFGTLVNALVALTAPSEAARMSVVTLPALTTACFFVLYRLTFARCWNRRAERLSRR